MLKVSAKSKQHYANLLPKDFDHFDCVKLAPGIYFILLFVLRAYVIWIMSVTNMRDHVGIIQWVYPQPHLFYFHLCSGAIALFVVLLLILRRPNAENWVKTCWRKCHVFLVIALVFDFFVTGLGCLIWHLQPISWLLIHSLLVILAISYIVKSKRFAINLIEFPEALTDK